MIRGSGNLNEGRAGNQKRLTPNEGTAISQAYQRAITGKPFRLDDITDKPVNCARLLESYDLIVRGRKGTFQCTGVLHKGQIVPVAVLYPAIERQLITQLGGILRDI